MKTLKMTCDSSSLPSRALRLFSETTFRNLTDFDTTLPHSSLVHFITRHFDLSSLTVGRCSFESTDGPCPFSDLDGNYHSSIISLSGPMSCIVHLLDGNPITLLDLSWSGGLYIPLFLEKAGSCSQTIVQLDLEYSAEYPRLLNGVGELLPELYSLRL